MYHTLKKQLFPFLMGGALLAANACGDDDNHDHPDAAPKADAGPQFDAKPDFDATPPKLKGTVALAEVAISNPALEAAAYRGASVNVSFTDPADVTVAPHPDFTNNIGACRIFVYDVAGGQAAPTGSDGGLVTITGTNAGDFACSYNATEDDYLCQSTDSAATGAVPMAGTSLTSDGMGGAQLVIAGADFSNANYKGMHILLSDFDNAAANDAHAIVGMGGAADTLLLGNPKLAAISAGTSSAPSKDTTYVTFVGSGPIPGGYDFLDDGTNKVHITKPETEDWAAIDLELGANGQFVAETGAGPTWTPRAHEFPLTADADVSFACGDGDKETLDCGTANGVLKGVTIFGETTDGELDPQNPTHMPDPVGSYATFQCSGVQQEAMTISKEALALILGTNPTRIQTTLLYINADTNQGTLIVGHGEVGFTDVPATESAKK